MDKQNTITISPKYKHLSFEHSGFKQFENQKVPNSAKYALFSCQMLLQYMLYGVVLYDIM